MKISADLFSGAGGVAKGAKMAGYEHAWGLEFNPAIAEIYRENIGQVYVQDILEANPYKFEKVDLLHASPVCKSYSTANPNKGEKALDIACAHKVAEFIKVLEPQTFTLENVQAYATSKDNRAFNIILERLYSLGYWVNYQVLNAADFKVPQSRRRLILIAVKSGFIPPLPPKQKHVGWYAAIADLVHDLPDSQLAEWQIKALPSEIRDHCFYTYGSQNVNFGGMLRGKDQPANTLLADCCSENGIRNYKAILIENTGARSDRKLQTRAANDPCWTLRAMGQDGHYHRANALLENAKVKALDIRCLARLQSFPDDYKWTGKKSIDGMGIGNSVPPLMYKAISEILL